MTTPAPVSFTVRRPSPVSRSTSSGPDSDGPSFKVPALPRHLTRADSKTGSPLGRSSPVPKKAQSRTYDERDSSDESDDGADELVTGFDQFGVQRAVERKKPEGPLVIAPLKNRDWREVARKRRTSERFIPGAGKAATGADGSVGGLGTRDSINSGPQLIGLQKRVKHEHDGDMDIDSAPGSGYITPAEESGAESVKKEEETEEQRALRALLKGDADDDTLAIPAIPIRALSESEALQQDVAELPDVSSLDDYERVPVSQFGAAMLRGMGWKPEAEQKNAGKTGKRPAQPWIPEQRPALLGIGAKEREVLDDGGPKKRLGGKGAQMKYMPVLKKEREGSNSGTAANGREKDDEQDRRRDGKGKDRRRDDRGDHNREKRERDHDSRDRDRDRRDEGDDRDRSSRRDRDHRYDDRDRRRESRRDYDRSDHRREERDYDGHRSRDSPRDRSRDRDRKR